MRLTALLELPLSAFVIIKFAIRDNPDRAVLVCDWLISGYQIYDAEPRMPKRHPAVGRYPGLLIVRAAVLQRVQSLLEVLPRNAAVLRKDGDNPAH